MKLNRRLLPWFLAAEISVIIVFAAILICKEMSDAVFFFTASIPFLLAFGGKCAEIKGDHPKVMPLLIGVPAVIAAALIIAGAVKDAVEPFGWVTGHLYIAPFLMKLLLPAVIISAAMEIIIMIKRRKAGYIFDETDTAGVLPCIIIIAATAFLFWFSAYGIRHQTALYSRI